MFFYFQSTARGGGNHHFWKYLDLKDGSVIDNRYIIANLISCAPDAPRYVDPVIFAPVFENQEAVISDLLASQENKRALDAAPRSVDPVQQNVATAIQSYLNHPDIDRAEGIEAIRYLNEPMLKVQLATLKKAYREFTGTTDVKGLLAVVSDLRKKYGAGAVRSDSTKYTPGSLTRGDLRLVCFDFISS